MHAHSERELLKDGELFEQTYRVVRELGRGGFGVVYLAHQETIDRMVALKVLKPEISDLDPTARRRFLREIHIISNLRRANSVTIYNFGESEDGLLYMALEHLDGEDLRSLLARRGRLPLDQALRLIRQVAQALEEAHEHGIVHRDLNPANIMLIERDGIDDFVKVLDFGVASLRDSEIDLTSIGVPEGQRSLMGTPRYMSPEQVRGEPLQGASDIYSLGLLLYEMLFGEPAVQGETVLDLIRAQNSETALALEKLAELPQPAQQLLRRATAKSLDQRYRSAADFIDAVDDLLTPSHAPRPAPTESPPSPKPPPQLVPSLTRPTTNDSAPSNEESALAFGARLTILLLLGGVTGFAVYILMIIVGSLVGDLVDPALRLIIASVAALCVPFFTGLNEWTDRDDRGLVSLLTRACLATILVCGAAVTVSSVAMPARIVDHLRYDHSWVAPESATHRNVALAVADVVEKTNRAIGRLPDDPDKLTAPTR